MADSGYSTSAPNSGEASYSGGADEPKTKTEYLSLGKLKGQFEEYLFSKQAEIEEQKESRRYYHGAHWTAAQIKAFKDRKQPTVTYNRIGRKINGVVGLLEKMRQDPKAYPRTPQQEDGAELATAALRYVLDEQEWKAKSPQVGLDGAVDGIGGLEIEIIEGDRGDKEVGFSIVDPDSYFYDPRSYKADFSDARYHGVAKWVDVELAKEMFPDKADEIEASRMSGAELSTNPDREQKWFHSNGRSIRLVDHWYEKSGKWCYCVYTGSMKLTEGVSHLMDEKDKTFSKFIMFSANIDHDGDRYGFVRNMKSAQDEVNMRRAKGLHILNSRRIIAEKGAFTNIEETRREAARPDGIIIKNPGMEAEFDDNRAMADLNGHVKFLEDAKSEIENYGFNPALIGTGVQDMSGRAIALQQQAGVAELGPYIIAYRGWKLRVYRAIFNSIQRFWTGERWIRVTDDENLAQFIKINGVSVDRQTGQPQLVNALGSLDVDIIIDEGPDQINMMADTYETLQMLASKGTAVPPSVLIEVSNLPGSMKKKLQGMMQQASQPNPMQQLQTQELASKIKQTDADTQLKGAQVVKTLADAHSVAQPEQMSAPEPQLPMSLQAHQVMADINSTNASADHKQAQADKIRQDTAMAPLEFLQNAANAEEDRKLAAKQKQAQPA